MIKMVDTKNTYWSNTGKFNDLATQLQTLIPVEGSIKGSKNAALERFRKAQNSYYDLYNNGLMNRARTFSSVFNIRVTEFKHRTRYGFAYAQPMYVLCERRMDEIILMAAEEQGLFCFIK
jgi:hypothetical protein